MRGRAEAGVSLNSVPVAGTVDSARPGVTSVGEEGSLGGGSRCGWQEARAALPLCLESLVSRDRPELGQGAFPVAG